MVYLFESELSENKSIFFALTHIFDNSIVVTSLAICSLDMFLTFKFFEKPNFLHIKSELDFPIPNICVSAKNIDLFSDNSDSNKYTINFTGNKVILQDN